MGRNRRSARRRGLAKLSPAVAALAAAVVAAALVPAYASSRTGPAPAGEARGTVSGFAVSGVHWGIGASGSLETVAFRLAPASARTVRVRIAAAGPWVDCAVTAGRASCALPAGTPPAAVDELSVLAF